jgi:hypothetical protein
MNQVAMGTLSRHQWCQHYRTAFATIRASFSLEVSEGGDQVEGVPSQSPVMIHQDATLSESGSEANDTVPSPNTAPLSSLNRQYDHLRAFRVEIQSIETLFSEVRAGLANLDIYQDWIQARLRRGEELMCKIEEHGARAKSEQGTQPLQERKSWHIGRHDHHEGHSQADERIAGETIYFLRDTWDEIRMCPLLKPAQTSPQLLRKESITCL